MAEKNLRQKIAAIGGAVGKLVKADVNKFAKYSYVSIDDLYGQVAKQVMAAGIVWTVTEESSAPYVSSDNGKEYIRTVYAFRVYDTDGDETMDHIRVSVIHPMIGAQTAGSSMSYAEKLLLRHLFKLETGEEDADTQDNVTPAPKKEVSRPPAKVVATIEETTLADDIYIDTDKLFRAAATVEDLHAALTKQKGDLARLKKIDPAAHARLQKFFSESIENMEAK